MPKHAVIRRLEARIEIARGVRLHVLQRDTRERQPAHEAHECAAARVAPPREHHFHGLGPLEGVVVRADVLVSRYPWHQIHFSQERERKCEAHADVIPDVGLHEAKDA